MFIKISADYSDALGGRYIKEGDFSGEDFRDNMLEGMYLQCLENSEALVIDFDDLYGCPCGFLEEAFGGMIRKGYSMKEMLDTISFIANDNPEVIEEIKNYMEEAEVRVSLNRKK